MDKKICAVCLPVDKSAVVIVAIISNEVAAPRRKRRGVAEAVLFSCPLYFTG
jgi:hypothetical protein